MAFIRQSEIISTEKLEKNHVSIIGAGSVGSFTTLILTKMGVGSVEVFDEDGVAEHNIAGQFYRKKDIGQYKADSLKELVSDFSISKGTFNNRHYKNEPLLETVIVTTDSMASRRLVWNEFLKQPQTKNFIDARMGAELAKLYTIRDKTPGSIKFYEATLHSDKESVKLPCTARTIIYNVNMIAAFIGRAFKAITQEEKFPKELIFNMTRIDDLSWMLRDE
jgi:hypothetical protein